MSNVVYYSQEDARWRNVPYTIRNDKTQTIGTSACGPTCLAMVAATWRDKSIRPSDTAKWAIAHGYRTPNDGTSWGYFKAAAEKEYGLNCKQTGSLDEVKRALSSGALVIASMGPGDFTGGGHYILLVGINGRMIDVYDPNHDNAKYGKLVDQGTRNDGKVRADESVFRAQARQYWIFEKPKLEDEAMTDTERKQFEQMGKKVDELSSAVTTLTIQLAAVKEAVPAPKWFISEFERDGHPSVLARMSDPVGTTDFWRSLAVSLRMQGLGKGRE